MPGSPADMVVLPAAPREGGERAAAFAEVRPRMVLLDGEVVIDH